MGEELKVERDKERGRRDICGEKTQTEPQTGESIPDRRKMKGRKHIYLEGRFTNME